MNYGDNIKAESFGQSESLCRRLSNILALYPEGTSIISELIQNSDDAGASEVKLMFNSSAYETASLLSSKMTEVQGPALYFYNNAEFKENDFQALSRIGQASKLEKLETTGRFGLGFNAVYHFTDVPSFVSGDSLIMLDPHCSYIPDATPHKPGVRFNIIGGELLLKYPDQFSPYLFFNCSLKTHYKGTLFRFPLRTEKGVQTSEIKNTKYSKSEIMEMINSFGASISNYLLFLRNVKKISVYTYDNKTDAEPVLLYETAITDRNDQTWNQIPRFLYGDGDKLALSKKAFHDKLLATSEAQLPKTIQLFNIETYFCKEESRVVERFFVSNRLGGGVAKRMATEMPAMKLLPWGGVAACISRHRVINGEKLDDEASIVKVGRAFCFLPLPVETSLPIHLNGYFELSANRRDIWYGTDLSGDGLVRSDWNVALLCDVIAPSYVRLLVEVATMVKLRQNNFTLDKYYALFPTTMPSQPWKHVVESIFKLVKQHPVLWSDVKNGCWVRPDQSVLIRKAADKQWLVDCLLEENVPVVVVPDKLFDLLVETKIVKHQVTPEFVRKLLKLERAHPSLKSVDAKEENSTEKLKQMKICLERVGLYLKYCMSDLIESKLFSQLDGLPLLPMANGQVGTIHVPHSFYSADEPSDLSDLNTALKNYYKRHNPQKLSSVDRILSGFGSKGNIKGRHMLEAALMKQYNEGLGNILMAAVTLEAKDTGSTSKTDVSNLYLCSHVENELLCGGNGKLISPYLHDELRTVLSSKSFQSATNVRTLNIQHFSSMLKYVLPSNWLNQPEVIWEYDESERKKDVELEFININMDVVSKAKDDEDTVNVVDEEDAELNKLVGNVKNNTIDDLLLEDMFNRELLSYKAHQVPTVKYIRKLWHYISNSNDSQVLASFENGLPLLPTLQYSDSESLEKPYPMSTLVTLKRNSQFVVNAKSLVNYDNTNVNSSNILLSLLCKLGVRLLDTDLLPVNMVSSMNKSKDDTIDLSNFALPATPLCILSALYHACCNIVEADSTTGSMLDALKFINHGDKFGGLSDDEIDQFRLYLSTSLYDNSNLSHQITELHMKVLASLPIYRVFGNSGFSDITKVLYLPPANVDQALLSSKFVKCTHSNDNGLYKLLGVKEISYTEFLMHHVFPRLPLIDSAIRDETMKNVLLDIHRLCGENAAFRAALDGVAFIPVASSVTDKSNTIQLRKVTEIYDSENENLKSLLDEEYFPLKGSVFTTTESILMLRHLGMKNHLNRDGIIQSAESIEKNVKFALSNLRSPNLDPHSVQEQVALIDKTIARASKLFGLVDISCEKLITETSSEPYYQHFDDVPGAVSKLDKDGYEFFRKLSTIEWIPIQTKSTDQYLPWSTEIDLVQTAETDLLSSSIRDSSLPVLCATLIRPQEDSWLCSSSFGLLSTEATAQLRSPALKFLFGWTENSIPCSVVASQLGSISKKYNSNEMNYVNSEYRRIISVKLPALYSYLSDNLFEIEHVQTTAADTDVDIKISSDDNVGNEAEGIGISQAVDELMKEENQDQEDLNSKKSYEEDSDLSVEKEDAHDTSVLKVTIKDQAMLEQVQSILQEANWIWIGNKFIKSEQIAFQLLLNAEPFLYCVPHEMAINYGTLLKYMGVRPSFGRQEFIDALNSMPASTVLNSKTFDFAVSLVKLISETININDPLRSKLLIPCDDYKLHSMKKCVYDDTPWLEVDTQNKYHKVHANVSNEVAKLLGIKSLRQILLSNQSSFSLLCPSAKMLRKSFDQCSNGEQMLPGDMAEIAKYFGINEVSFFIDENFYSKQSVLEPSLGNIQGPSIVCYFPDVTLASDQLIWLLSGHHDTSSWISKEMHNFNGNSLATCFELTDCLQILTGSYLYMLDPCGNFFSDISSRSPTHTNISQTTATGASASKGRSFCFVDTDILERFPDQFKPFTSLPVFDQSVDDLKRQGFNGTIFRLPLRQKPSALGDKVFSNPFDVDNLINHYKANLPELLIYSYKPSKLSFHRISELEKGSGNSKYITELIVKAELQGAVEQLDVYWKRLRNNKEWSKSRISSLFRGKISYEPMNSTFEVDIHVEKSGGVLNKEKYLIHAVSGGSEPRGIATTAAAERLGLNPIIAIAAHIERNGDRAPLMPEGKVFTSAIPIPALSSGLPVHISGTFQLKQGTRALILPLINRSSGQHDLYNDEALLGSWNCKLLQSALEDGFLPMVLILRKRYKHSSHPARLYRFWPTRSIIINALSAPRQLLPDSIVVNLYEQLARLPIFLSSSLTNATYLKAHEGYLPLGDGSITPMVHAFSIKHFPLFRIPSQVAADLEEILAAKSKEKPVKHLTPKEMRNFLHKNYKMHPKWIIDAAVNVSKLAAQAIDSSDESKVIGKITPSMLALELLEFCLSDVNYPFESENEGDLSSESDLQSIEKVIELKGLALVPLADGNIDRFASSSSSKNSIILATDSQQFLLSPQLKSVFLSSEAMRRLGGLNLGRYFDSRIIQKTLNLRPFDITFLANNIGKVLPSVWKNKQCIDWKHEDRHVISKLWLYQFWKQVQVRNLLKVDLFSQWPLIPCKNDKLISCSSISMVLYLSRSLSKDIELEKSLTLSLNQIKEKELNDRRMNQETIKAAINVCYDEWQQMHDLADKADQGESDDEEYKRPPHESYHAVADGEDDQDDITSKVDVSEKEMKQHNSQTLLKQAEELRKAHEDRLNRQRAQSDVANQNVMDAEIVENLVVQEARAVDNEFEDAADSEDENAFVTPTSNIDYGFSNEDNSNEEFAEVFGLIQKLNIPLIEISYFLNLNNFYRIANGYEDIYMPQEIAMNRRVSAIILALSHMERQIPHEIRWTDLSEEDRVSMLKLFGSATTRFHEPLVNSERLAIKSMPLFVFEVNNSDTTSFASLDENAEYFVLSSSQVDFNEAPFLRPNLIELNKNTTSKKGYLLKDFSHIPEVKELYNDLNIIHINECGLYVRFLIPSYHFQSCEHQQLIIKRIVERWPSLKETDTSNIITIPEVRSNVANDDDDDDDAASSEPLQHTQIVKSLKSLQFLIVAGVAVKAKSLFDPDNVLLSAVYEDEPHKFPQGEWLDRLSFLRDIGMCNKITRSIYIRCAKKLAAIGETADGSLDDYNLPLRSRSSGNMTTSIVSPMSFDRAHFVAKLLIEYLCTNFTQLHTPQFTREISSLSFVPVVRPITDDSKYIASRKAMVRYNQCALPRDFHLVWTQLPVLTDNVLLPEASFSNLGIVRPPKLHFVIQHLKTVTSHPDVLFISREKADMVKVFSKIYEYLDDNWTSLSQGIKDTLKSMNIIPVNSNNDGRNEFHAHLVKPSRTFFRMSHDLSPFMFEMPRHFGAYEQLLTSLGSKEEPLVSDYLHFLSDLRSEVGANPLNPNELRAVLKVIELIHDSKSKWSNGQNKLFIPNSNAVLTNSAQCIIRDEAWLANRVDLTRCRHEIPLYYAHPLIPARICDGLNINQLSHVVYDELQTAFNIERLYPNNNEYVVDPDSEFEDIICEKSEILLTVSLSSTKFIEAVTHLIIQQELKNLINFNSLMNHVKNAFREFRVHFVKKLQSKYILKIHNKQYDVTNLSMLENTSYYINNDKRIIYIANVNKLVKPSHILAMAVNQILSAYHAVAHEIKALNNLLPLAALFSFASKDVSINNIMSDLRLSVDDNVYIENQLGRGVPGSYLSSYDLNCVELKPLRNFLNGEIVAINDKETNKLIYAVVVDDGNQESASQSNSLNQHQTAVRKIKLKTAVDPDVDLLVLSTEVYSFKSANLKDDYADDNDDDDFNVDAESNTSISQSTSGLNAASTLPRQPNEQQHVSNEELLNALNSLMLQLGLTSTATGAKEALSQNELLANNIRLAESYRLAAASEQSLKEELEGLRKDHDKLKSTFICQICLANDVDRFIIDCGHLLCNACLGKCNGKCPFDRKRITQVCNYYRP